MFRNYSAVVSLRFVFAAAVLWLPADNRPSEVGWSVATPTATNWAVI